LQKALEQLEANPAEATLAAKTAAAAAVATETTTVAALTAKAAAVVAVVAVAPVNTKIAAVAAVFTRAAAGGAGAAARAAAVRATLLAAGGVQKACDILHELSEGRLRTGEIARLKRGTDRFKGLLQRVEGDRWALSGGGRAGAGGSA